MGSLLSTYGGSGLWIIIPDLILAKAMEKSGLARRITLLIATSVAIVLPVNTIPNLVFHSSGYFTEKQIIVYGLVTSLVSVVLTLLVGLPYGTMLGLV